MTHYCTACSSEFEDDSITPANADCVHCVFCGAKIPLARRASARAPTSVVPFSKDYEREEAFALGIINHSGPGFPDTLRQFRVPSGSRPDSLSPLARGSEHPGPLPIRAPRRLVSLSLSLSVGFGVGVALAFAAVSLRPSAGVQHPATASAAAVPAGQAPPNAKQATEPATLAARASEAPPPTAMTLPTSATPALPATRVQPVAPAMPAMPTPAQLAATKPTAEQNRRWWLDRARAEQRQYHLTAAEQLYRQVLARTPNDSEALSGLGELDLLRGTVDLASAHFQQALEANANYIPALVAAADLLWQAGRAEEARQAYLDIVDHYSADLYPPYVALRSTPVTTPPCER
jgi:hypothetical protein